MVKPPRIRHSKSRKDPVTIELGPDEVSRVADELRGDDPATIVDDQQAPPSSSAPGHEEETAAPVGVDEMPASHADAPNDGDRAAEPAGTTTFGRDADRPYASAPPHAPEPPRQRRVASALVAGLVGGVIALAGAGALNFAGYIGPERAVPGQQDSETDALRAEIAALRDEIAGMGPDQRIDGLASDLSALRNEIATLRSAPSDDGASAALEERLTALEGRIATLAESTGDADALAGLGSRLNTVEQAARQSGEASGALAARLDALDRDMAALTEKVEAEAAQPHLALSIAASALKSAVDRGGPFTTELDTYAAIAPEATEIAALRDFAETGVATRSAIAAEAPEASRAMIAAARPVDPNAGFFDRLVTSATSLVDVRPVGTVEGDDAGAISARMEVAVQAEDYAAALAEYEKLPEAAKAAGAGFIAKVRARQEVDRLVGQTMAAALAAQGREG
jgi:hypothetical protein